MSEQDKRAEEVLETRIEQLAAYAHEAEKMGGNDFWETLPVDWKNEWIRQANTEYADLSEDEKKSDRVEARRIIAIVLGPVAAALAQARREGKKEMYSVLAECIRGLRRMRRGTKTELLKLLDALYARLLPKEEAGER